MSVNDEDFLQKKIPSIGILSIMYVFIGFFTDNKIISPFDINNYIQNVELIVPISAALIFTGLIGGSVAALGIILLEVMLRINGSVNEPIGIEVLFLSISYFIGVWIIGSFAAESEITGSIRELLFRFKTWFRIFINTIISIIGIALIAPLILGFGVEFLINNRIEEGLMLFLELFKENLYLTVTVVPITILLYDIISVFRKKREIKLDKEYHNLKVKVNADGPGELKRVYFSDNAFRVGQWTPLHIEFKHTWKAGRSYEIESISTSRLYPHIDNTPVLNKNDKWTHIIYVLPLKQDHVDIKVRLTPSHTKKYKQVSDNQTTVTIQGKTYVRRDLLLISVIFLSEVIIFLFLFSVLWNQIIAVFSELISKKDVASTRNITVPWNAMIAIGAVEAVFFIPFLLLMYFIQIPSDPDSVPDDLAFSQDITTHQYLNKKFSKDRSKFYQNLSSIVITIVTFATAVIGTISLWQLSNSKMTINIEGLDDPSIIFGITIFTLGLWIISAYFLKNLWIQFEGRKNYSLSAGKYVKDILPLSQFKVNEPTEMLLTAENMHKNPGLRLLFKGNDAISPPMLELHIDPNETAKLKLAITPLTRGDQNVLVVIYPLFDKDGNYIKIEDTQPLAYQNINFKALGETTIGITDTQLRTLKHIFGWGSLIASTITFTNRFVGVEEVINQWRDSVPWLVTLQVPFVYLYYLFSNRFITSIAAY